MSETEYFENDYLPTPALPAGRRAVTERAPERRQSVLDAFHTLGAIREMVLPAGATDQSDTALVVRVWELVDQEWLDEGDGK